MTQEARYDAVTALRIEIQDALNAKDDEKVLSLAAGMREGDPGYWPLLWAGACAMSAMRLGRRDEAWALLDEAVAGGCHQPALFEPELNCSARTRGTPSCSRRWRRTYPRHPWSCSNGRGPYRRCPCSSTASRPSAKIAAKHYTGVGTG